MQAFRDTSLEANFRDIQPLNGRKVYTSYGIDSNNNNNTFTDFLVKLLKIFIEFLNPESLD